MFTRRSLIKTASLALPASVFPAMALAGCAQGNYAPQVLEFDALGAPAFIKLERISERRAKMLFDAARAEVLRLESIFSLYQEASEISRLNRDAKLSPASLEILEVLKEARTLSEMTDGVFDITVQSLWQAAIKPDSAKEPSLKEGTSRANETYSRVDYRFVKLHSNSVSFARPNVTITLNAIAQGYITDRICFLLQKHGARSGLVNIGEFRSFGPKTWTLGIQDPHNPVEILETIELKNEALATSSHRGGYINDQLSHIIKPKIEDGSGKPKFISVSIVAASAMRADGLATAFTMMEFDDIKRVAKLAGVKRAILVKENREIIRL
ncbi:MAG: FAD:protein FMN transferase [Robiginitomaculum sp.]